MDQVLGAAKARGFPAPLFVHRASVEDADKFFGKRAPEVRAIADPDGALFAAFGLKRGSLLQLMGPGVVWRAFAAMLKGNFVGRPTGNETQMPGAFLVRGQEILSAHRARHGGDQPDLVAMLRSLDPNAATAIASDSGKARSGAGAAKKKLEAQHRKLLAKARDIQRSGDLRAFAAATERAEEVARQIDALEEQSA